MTAMITRGGGAVEQFNDLGYGTLSGRLQTLSMYRDYDNGINAHSTTLALQLDYLSPEKSGWSIGASYIGAGVLDSMDYATAPNPGDALVLNGRVNVLNEGYLHYKMDSLGLTNSTALIGRRTNNGEVFRYDDFRQKRRSLEALIVETRDIENTQLTFGHAWKESNIWGTDSHPTISSWAFQDFGEVFNTGYDTDGVTWGEGVYKGIEKLEIAAFDAIAWDVVNLLGVRARYAIGQETALLAYYRNESDIGRNDGHDANVFGLSAAQQIGEVTLEGGYFGVFGDNLEFEELSTGINHALGSSMMIYSQQFNGGSDTLYLKAVTTLEASRTVLYGLYNYTQHDTDKAGAIQRYGQELNLVVKQPVPKLDNLSAALKVGLGYRDGINGVPDTFATDTRLFLTYTF
jgi:hypothetical protein